MDKIKKIFAAIVKFARSLITDKDWDGDAVKVFGIAILGCGIAGFFLRLPDFQWMIGFGAGLVATGKFSAQG